MKINLAEATEKVKSVKQGTRQYVQQTYISTF